MRKVLMAFLSTTLIFIACGEGNTKRTRCNGEVKSNNNTVIDTDRCLRFLSISYGKTDSENQNLFNRTLISCLLYNMEMYKCEKKSNILPP